MLITLDEAAKRLSAGEIIAVPTETVYGLAASIYHPEAIQQIFALKGRPSDNPLITHIANLDQLAPLIGAGPDDFEALCKAFWPGPLTLVVPAKEEMLPPAIRAGLPTAAFRMPRHEAALQLIAKTGPLVMPSANLSGKPSSTSPDHIEQDFGKAFPILESGQRSCKLGLESTVLIAKEGVWTIGRVGAIPPEELESVLGYRPSFGMKSSKPLCPGQRYRHYAPQCKLLVGTEMPTGIDVILGFDEREYPPGAKVLSMGSLSSPESAAQRLYTLLRLLDIDEIPEAWVDTNFPEQGLWASIRERLHKAAGKVDEI